jgi:aldose 1-epimerase
MVKANCKEAPAYKEVLAENYQQLLHGKQVELFTLKNKQGLVAKVTNFGARLVQLLVPDREGRLDDVTLGYDTLAEASTHQLSAGATIGRYANRIDKGEFTLDGHTYHLSINNVINSLHGGTTGSRTQVFDAKQLDDATVEMHLLFKDGQDGYPGNCHLTTTFHLTDDNALVCTYTATTDKPTIINFCNHAYWNLNGIGNGDILGHELTIYADEYTPVSKDLITTGAIEKVQGTNLDFTTPHKIGARQDGIYDNNFVIRKQSGNKLQHAATVYAPESGRVLDVYTTEPGLQFYSGSGLNGEKDIGKGGKHYVSRGALALEAQKYPDSIHKPNWPSSVLRPGETYHSETHYKFSVK